MTHNAPREIVIAELRQGNEYNAKDLNAAPGQNRDLLGAVPGPNDGQSLSVSYVPGKGTTVVASGGLEVLVPGKDFADAFSVRG